MTLATDPVDKEKVLLGGRIATQQLVQQQESLNIIRSEN